jgi:hypothetical protein
MVSETPMKRGWFGKYRESGSLFPKFSSPAINNP